MGGSLVKVGVATETLAPLPNFGSSYTGATVVANGTLTLQFNVAGSDAPVLYNGVAPGNVTLGGSYISPLSSLSANGTINVASTATLTITTNPGNGATPNVNLQQSGTLTQAFGTLILAPYSSDTLNLANLPAAGNAVFLNVTVNSITRNTGSTLYILTTPNNSAAPASPA